MKTLFESVVNPDSLRLSYLSDFPSKNLLSAAPMMIKYWNETFEDEQVKKFISYFDSTYVSGPLKNWYEGLSDFLTNNNGLEANNRSIKVKNIADVICEP